MPKIAIVAALEREVQPLIRRWRASEREHGGRRLRFYENEHAVVICGGIGSEPARRAAEAILALYQPAVIYSAGFAGALDRKLHVADIVVPRRVVNASDGSSVDTGQGEGLLISFPSVASPEQKAKLGDSYGAQAIDMEAAAVAKAAEARGVPFAAVKAISDESDFTLPLMDRFINADGQFNAPRFALFAAVRPWIWGSTLQLARNSRCAAQALCAWIEGLDVNQILSTQTPVSHDVGSVHQR